MKRAVAIAVPILLVTSLAFSAWRSLEPSTREDARTMENLTERVGHLEAELDRVATALEASAAQRSDSPIQRGGDEALQQLADAIASPEGEAMLRAAIDALATSSRDTPRWQALRDAGRQRLEARRRAPETRFGDHGWRIASLSSDLDLTSSQQESYHDLLLEYEERAADLLEANGLDDVRDPARMGQQMQAIEAERSRIDAEFDVAFERALDRDQLERYRALPEHRRGLAPGAGADALAARGIGRLWAER